MIRKTLITILLIGWVFALQAAERSTTLVNIGGERYYIHRVESQQTIYSLAKLYGVSQSDINDSNPKVVNGLKAGDDIKIPYRQIEEQTVSSESLSRSERRRFDEHAVASGETLYSISRKYEISIDIIVEDNPSVDPVALSVGQNLLIRKREQGESDALKSLTEWKSYRDNLNRVAPDGYQFHIVERGETTYSLSRRYDMSEEDFERVNDLSAGLKMGALVLVRDSQSESGDESQSSEDSSAQQRRVVRFKAKSEAEQVRVALFLPLKVEGTVRKEFAEFYNGVLLAVADIKKSHPRRHISLDLYNSGRDSSLVASIARSAEFAGTDLIIGPIYEQCIEALLPYAYANSVPIVSPLSQISSLQGEGVVFQMPPSASSRYEKVGDLLSPQRHVTFIHTDKIDSIFYNQMLSMIPDTTKYQSHTYQYEHPDITRSRLKYNKNYISPSDLTPYIANKRDNTIIITSDNPMDVDRVLAALSSADSNQRARSLSKPSYLVLGSSAWGNYSSLDRSLLFSNGVTIFPSYEAKRSSEAVVRFDKRYIKGFRSTPSLYSYRGYDAATIFINGIYSDIEYKMQGSTYVPLQSPYLFMEDESVDGGSGVVRNVNSLRVNYNRDFTITIE